MEPPWKTTPWTNNTVEKKHRPKKCPKNYREKITVDFSRGGGIFSFRNRGKMEDQKNEPPALENAVICSTETGEPW